jgi:hypothetical protein
MSDDNVQGHESDEIIDYGALTEAELRERHTALSELIEELRAQPKTLEVAAAINDLRAERNVIVEAVRELRTVEADDSDDTGATFDAPVATEDTTDADTAEEDTATEAPAEAAPEAIAEEATVAEFDSPAEGDATVVAAEQIVAEAHVAGAGDRPVEPSAPNRPRIAFTAGAGQNIFSQGAELTIGDLGRAFESKKHLQPTPDGRPVQAVVAGLRAFEDTQELPVPVLSHRNNVSTNDAIISEAVSAWREKRDAERAGMPLAHTAAICDPLDIIREIPEVGVTDTPFASLFPQRPIGRLGFTYTPAASVSDTDDGIAVWTESDQDDVDPDDSATWKPCVDIACSTPTEAKAVELTTCVTVDTFVEMSSPERVREFLHLLGVQRSRRREQHLLGEWDDTASGYTFTGTYGTLPSLIQAVHTVLPQLLYGEREDAANYDLVLEPGFVNKLIYDEFNKAYTDPRDAEAVLREATGLNVVVLRDFAAASPFQTPPTPGGASATLAEVPDTNRVRIVPAGSYIYAATGEESTGWQTDPQLARQNKQQMFSAEWILLAKHSGAKAAFIDITSAGDGSRACCVEAFGTDTYEGS